MLDAIIFFIIYAIILIFIIGICIMTYKKTNKKIKEKKENKKYATKECINCKGNDIKIQIVPINKYTAVTYAVCQNCGHKEEIEREQTGINIIGLIIGIILIVIGLSLAFDFEIIPTIYIK